MRFSLTHKGQLRKLMLVLNDQQVFDSNWNVNKPKNEIVFSLNIDIPGRPYNAHTATETLFQFLSTGKTKHSLTMLVGLSKIEYKIDKEKFEAFLEICSERINKNYKYVTWFDVVMLLFIAQYLEHGSELRSWAKSHISGLVAKNQSIRPIMKSLSSTKVAPVI